ncbi:MAG TPA: XdhC family protein [Victivallales bacterium]|nr:XdhC family protein [Victivallales bacterium]
MNIYEKIIELQNLNTPFTLVTIIKKEGHAPQIPGAKMIVLHDGKTFGTIGGGAIEYIAANESTKIITSSKKSSIVDYILGENNEILDAVDTGMICGGKLSLFYEYMPNKDTVYIFGAGHVGKSISYHMKPLDYNLVLIDSRQKMADNYTENDQLIISDYKNIFDNNTIEKNAYIIVATHSHEMDYTIMKKTFESNVEPKYLGVIASKKKSVKMVERLCGDLKDKKLDLSKLYTPIGLKIGGSTPDEIAISIISELQAIKYGQEGQKNASDNWNSLDLLEN